MTPRPPEDHQTLAHSLQPRHVTMISLGGIIGAGIFVGSSAAINIAGPSVLFTYAMCGMLVFVIMRMLGEMAIARPGVGTFTGYIKLGLGPWAGFVCGWLYFYFWVVTIAVEAIAGAAILSDFMAVPPWIMSTALIVLTTLLNLLSVRAYGEAEFWFAALKVLTITCFIALGVAFIFGFGPGIGATVSTMKASGGLFPAGGMALFTAIPVVIFSMMGSEVATIAAVETENPAENVVRAARTVALRILFFYLGSIAVIVAIVPWNEIVPGHSPFADAMMRVHIPGAGAFMSAVVFTAVASCLNSAIYVTSRMLHEMAERGDAPGLFTYVSMRRVPSLAIVISSLAGFAMVLVSIASPERAFVFLLQSSGAIILCVYLLIAFSQIILRRRLDAAGESIPVKVWFFPYVSYALVAGILAVFALMATKPDLREQVSLCALLFVSAVVAYQFKRRAAIPPAEVA
ncbi:amino acid permease [Novosphingobium beihaiensis]|uniref:Amino acid permease n=1 Tax=Novosphingobium beihaiensis TaxID=2930389 RepID=A0ABT0BVX4_9SPHN|nr:amino acid permease [Novosphingobium beihaiensis]MCJ2189206.1 amino acid permease [Novosphingobium beihaiensis]